MSLLNLHFFVFRSQTFDLSKRILGFVAEQATTMTEPLFAKFLNIVRKKMPKHVPYFIPGY
jgi:hypothetical protein